MNTIEQKPSKSMTSFFAIWSGQAFSLLGSQLVQFALVWYLTETTGSATVLAMATMVALLPQIFLSPVAGALVDRWNRRRVMMAADGLIALATVALAALFAFDAVQIWHIYLLMFIRAAGAAFHWPAMQASTTLLVPDKYLSRIAGLNQGLWGLASIVSPPLGALLLGVLPMQSILAIDMGTAMLAIAPLVFITIPNPKRKVEDPRSEVEDPRSEGRRSDRADREDPKTEGLKTSVLVDLREGLRLVWDWPGLMIILGVATLLNLLITPAFALMPIMVTGYFGGGALELAWTEAAWGVGMVLGGVLMGFWGGFKRRMVTSALGLGLMGVGFITVGTASPAAFTLVLSALFLGGAMNPVVNGSVFAALQATVPPEMQGRIFTLLLSSSSAMAPLSLAIAGPLADAFGVQVWFVAGGLLTLAIGLGSFFVPAVMYFEDQGKKITEQRGKIEVDEPAEGHSMAESHSILPA